MRSLTYKTNRWLWLALFLTCFLFWFDGIEYVLALFAGKLRIDDLLDFDFVGSFVISIVMGWLVQCAIVIVWSWTRKKSNPTR